MWRRMPSPFHHLRRQLPLAACGVALLGAGLLAQQRNVAPGLIEAVAAETGILLEPRVLRDINPSGSSEPAGFIKFRNETYFRADNGANGVELWRTDGTFEGTSLVADINAGAASSTPDWMKAFRGRLYFAATSSATGREVWTTDGTAEGTTLLHDINPLAGDADPTAFVRLGRALYFRAQDGTTGQELWKTEGTPETTVLVADVHPGSEGSLPTYPTVFGNELFFAADDFFIQPTGFDRELWRTNGTLAGTTRVKDINPGGLPSVPGELTRLGQYLIFRASTRVEGGELWRTDGTEFGTQMIADINPGFGWSVPTDLVQSGGYVFFSADDGALGRELWRTDGTTAGTLRLADINPGGDSNPVGAAYQDGYLFAATDPMMGRELWFSDGTSAGTRLVKDLNPGLDSSAPLDITVVGRYAYFIVALQTPDFTGLFTELWRTDGTDAGTVRVWRAPGKFGGYSIRDLTAIGRTLYFSAPVDVDGDGMGTNFEPYILPLGAAGEAPSPDTPITDTLTRNLGLLTSTLEDFVKETRDTVDAIGLPIGRSTRAAASSASKTPTSGAGR
jgi:ELWxxDGT repeat protein